MWVVIVHFVNIGRIIDYHIKKHFFYNKGICIRKSKVMMFYLIFNIHGDPNAPVLKIPHYLPSVWYLSSFGGYGKGVVVVVVW